MRLCKYYAEGNGAAYERYNRDVCNKLSYKFLFAVGFVGEYLFCNGLAYFVKGFYLFPLFALSRKIGIFLKLFLRLFPVCLVGVFDLCKALTALIFKPSCSFFFKNHGVLGVLYNVVVNIVRELCFGQGSVFGVRVFL